MDICLSDENAGLLVDILVSSSVCVFVSLS